MFSGIQSKIIATLVVVVFVLGGIGYWYFTYSQNQIQTLIENNQKLETAVTEVNAQNLKMQESFNNQAKAKGQLEGKMNEIELRFAKIDETFRKHNLAILALKNPGLIESKINKATKKVFDEIEAETR